MKSISVGVEVLAPKVKFAESKSLIQTATWTLPAVGTALQQQELSQVPIDAIILAATATVTARPADKIVVGDAAQVRPAAGNKLVIDLQALRTVSGFDSPGPDVSKVEIWKGTRFETLSGIAGLPSIAVGFDEQLTERLQITFSAPVSPDDLAVDGVIFLPGAPSDPVVELNDRRLWSQPGQVRLGPVAGDDPAFVHTVDIAAGLQAAIDRGERPLRLAFRTAVPASSNWPSPSTSSRPMTWSCRRAGWWSMRRAKATTRCPCPCPPTAVRGPSPRSN